MEKLMTCIVVFVTLLSLSNEYRLFPPFISRKWKSTYGPLKYDRDKQNDRSITYEYSKYMINRKKNGPVKYGYSKHGTMKPQYDAPAAYEYPMYRSKQQIYGGPSIFDFGKQTYGTKSYGYSKYGTMQPQYAPAAYEYPMYRSKQYKNGGPSIVDFGKQTYGTKSYGDLKYGRFSKKEQFNYVPEGYGQSAFDGEHSVDQKFAPSNYGQYGGLQKPSGHLFPEYQYGHETDPSMPMASSDHHANANSYVPDTPTYTDTFYPPLNNYAHSKINEPPNVEIVTNIPKDTDKTRVWEVKNIKDLLPLPAKHVSIGESPKTLVHSHIPDVTSRIPSIAKADVPPFSALLPNNADFADVIIAEFDINLLMHTSGPHALCRPPNKVTCGARLPWAEVDGMDEWCESNCGDKTFRRYCDNIRCTCRCDNGDSVLWTYYRGDNE